MKPQLDAWADKLGQQLKELGTLTKDDTERFEFFLANRETVSSRLLNDIIRVRPNVEVEIPMLKIEQAQKDVDREKLLQGKEEHVAVVRQDAEKKLKELGRDIEASRAETVAERTHMEDLTKINVILDQEKQDLTASLSLFRQFRHRLHNHEVA